MTALIWFGVLAVYVAGLFPATVQILRQSAARGHCHREAQFGSNYRWGPANCREFCKKGCWRSDAPGVLDLPWTPFAFLWPLLALGLLALRQAGKVPPATADLQRQIDDLESQLGMDR